MTNEIENGVRIDHFTSTTLPWFSALIYHVSHDEELFNTIVRSIIAVDLKYYLEKYDE